MKKLWVFEWNDKWNSYADGSSTPFNSLLSSSSLFLMGELMKRRRVDGGWSPKANSNSGRIADCLHWRWSGWVGLLFFFVVGYGRWHRQWLRRKERTNKQTNNSNSTSSAANSKDSEIKHFFLSGCWWMSWRRVKQQSGKKWFDWTAHQAAPLRGKPKQNTKFSFFMKKKIGWFAAVVACSFFFSLFVLLGSSCLLFNQRRKDEQPTPTNQTHAFSYRGVWWLLVDGRELLFCCPSLFQ